jgi:acetolactate synthase I/II/III large subunit
MTTTPITGGQALAQAMSGQGIRTVFGTVGHGNLAFVDALADFPAIRFCPVFHEQVAIHAADAYYRVSGQVAVVTTTVGPGATNLATGLGDALLDSSAVVVVTGGVPSEYASRDALQALSVVADDTQAEIFRPLVKRVIRVPRAAELAGQFDRALRESLSGNPGPVVLHVPLDFFSAPVDAPAPCPPVRVPRPAPDPGLVDEATRLLAGSARPLIYCGGGTQSRLASAAITELAARFSIPVASTMSGQGVIAQDHPMSLGVTGAVGAAPANHAIRQADVILALGTRFPEMDASSWRPDYFAAVPPARLIHVDVDPRQFDRVFPAEVPVLADAAAAARALSAALAQAGGPDTNGWLESLAEVTRKWTSAVAQVAHDDGYPVEPAWLLRQLRSALPRETVLISGVGIRHAVAQHFDVYRPNSLVVGSGFGTMGQEVAAPIGASLGSPGQPVVALIGDGALLACLAALPTAAAERTDLVWVVLDNGGYASIATYQARHFGRFSGTSFVRSDGKPFDIGYRELAESFGIPAHRPAAPGEIVPAVQRAFAEPGPSLVVVQVTPSPRALASGHWDVNDILAAGASAGRGPDPGAGS